jgi:ATP-dependent Clp protease ATP-binding subunit ClpC
LGLPLSLRTPLFLLLGDSRPPSRYHRAMREELTDTFRAALASAQTAARQLNQDFISTDHLMLGLLSTDGEGTRTLHNVHAEADTVKAALLEQLPKGELAPVVTGDLPLSPKAQRAINGAIVKAQAMREPRVSTRFLLMSLIDEPGTAICKALDKAGTDVDALQPKLAEKPIAVEA